MSVCLADANEKLDDRPESLLDTRSYFSEAMRYFIPASISSLSLSPSELELDSVPEDDEHALSDEQLSESLDDDDDELDDEYDSESEFESEELEPESLPDDDL